MLDHPWPPPSPGPQQPRDAHGAAWRNGTRPRHAAAPSRPGASGWPDLAGEPAARRRHDDARSANRDDREDRGGPWRAGRPEGEAPRGRLPAPGTSWEPAAAWIPQPTPAPEQRWTPEQDWLTAFAAAPAVAPVRPRRAALRVWGPVLAVAVPLVLVLAAVALARG
ncbi:hypothetical protein [Cellulomonas iranensis]|uniref:hypothetical protein n=1 Tax=Cellulomonas iranensis TaxID=76862 RepID=UPI003D7E8E9F